MILKTEETDAKAYLKKYSQKHNVKINKIQKLKQD
jgi:hypothetical protein